MSSAAAQEHPRSEAVQLTQRLVQMPTTPGQGQREVAELLADRLESAGFAVSTHPSAGDNVEVVARFGDPDAASLCLAAHLDTVPVVEHEWSQDPFGGVIDGDRLWGRGSCDMKSGAAAAVHAAVTWAGRSGLDRAPVTLVLTSEEELGCLGAARLAEDPASLPQVEWLVVAEPTSNRPLLGHRGAVWVDLDATGRSCHASTPHLGENAIDKLVRSLSSVHAWADQHPSTHEVLGGRTLSVGRIEGGVLRNIVPDRARAQLDFRVSDPDEVTGLARALAAEVAGLAEVVEVLALPPVAAEWDDPFVREVRDIARPHLDDAPEPAAARFFTDASVLTPVLGSPSTVIWGPGSADRAHVVDEWCSVREVVAATAMYEQLLDRHAARVRSGASS